MKRERWAYCCMPNLSLTAEGVWIEEPKERANLFIFLELFMSAQVVLKQGSW